MEKPIFTINLKNPSKTKKKHLIKFQSLVEITTVHVLPKGTELNGLISISDENPQVSFFYHHLDPATKKDKYIPYTPEKSRVQTMHLLVQSSSDVGLAIYGFPLSPKMTSDEPKKTDENNNIPKVSNENTQPKKIDQKEKEKIKDILESNNIEKRKSKEEVTLKLPPFVQQQEGSLNLLASLMGTKPTSSQEQIQQRQKKQQNQQQPGQIFFTPKTPSFKQVDLNPIYGPLIMDFKTMMIKFFDYLQQFESSNEEMEDGEADDFTDLMEPLFAPPLGIKKLISLVKLSFGNSAKTFEELDGFEKLISFFEDENTHIMLKHLVLYVILCFLQHSSLQQVLFAKHQSFIDGLKKHETLYPGPLQAFKTKSKKRFKENSLEYCRDQIILLSDFFQAQQMILNKFPVIETDSNDTEKMEIDDHKNSEDLETLWTGIIEKVEVYLKFFCESFLPPYYRNLNVISLEIDWPDLEGWRLLATLFESFIPRIIQQKVQYLSKDQKSPGLDLFMFKLFFSSPETRNDSSLLLLDNFLKAQEFQYFFSFLISASDQYSNEWKSFCFDFFLIEKLRSERPLEHSNVHIGLLLFQSSVCLNILTKSFQEVLNERETELLHSLMDFRTGHNVIDYFLLKMNYLENLFEQIHSKRLPTIPNWSLVQRFFKEMVAEYPIQMWLSDPEIFFNLLDSEKELKEQFEKFSSNDIQVLVCMELLEQMMIQEEKTIIKEWFMFLYENLYGILSEEKSEEYYEFFLYAKMILRELNFSLNDPCDEKPLHKLHLMIEQLTEDSEHNSFEKILVEMVQSLLKSLFLRNSGTIESLSAVSNTLDWKRKWMPILTYLMGILNRYMFFYNLNSIERSYFYIDSAKNIESLFSDIDHSSPSLRSKSSPFVSSSSPYSQSPFQIQSIMNFKEFSQPKQMDEEMSARTLKQKIKNQKEHLKILQTDTLFILKNFTGCQELFYGGLEILRNLLQQTDLLVNLYFSDKYFSLADSDKKERTKRVITDDNDNELKIYLEKKFENQLLEHPLLQISLNLVLKACQMDEKRPTYLFSYFRYEIPMNDFIDFLFYYSKFSMEHSFMTILIFLMIISNLGLETEEGELEDTPLDVENEKIHFFRRKFHKYRSQLERMFEWFSADEICFHWFCLFIRQLLNHQILLMDDFILIFDLKVKDALKEMEERLKKQSGMDSIGFYLLSLYRYFHFFNQLITMTSFSFIENETEVEIKLTPLKQSQCRKLKTFYHRILQFSKLFPECLLTLKSPSVSYTGLFAELLSLLLTVNELYPDKTSLVNMSDILISMITFITLEIPDIQDLNDYKKLTFEFLKAHLLFQKSLPNEAVFHQLNRNWKKTFFEYLESKVSLDKDEIDFLNDFIWKNSLSLCQIIGYKSLPVTLQKVLPEQQTSAAALPFTTLLGNEFSQPVDKQKKQPLKPYMSIHKIISKQQMNQEMSYLNDLLKKPKDIFYPSYKSLKQKHQTEQKQKSVRIWWRGRVQIEQPDIYKNKSFTEPYERRFSMRGMHVDTYQRIRKRKANDKDKEGSKKVLRSASPKGLFHEREYTKNY